MSNLNFVKVCGFGIIFFACGFIGIAISHFIVYLDLKKNGIETISTVDSILSLQILIGKGKCIL